MKKELEPIAYIKSPFKDKFGIPRQSGMTEGIISEIVLVPEYRRVDAVRGLSDFSHIWVLWEFSGFDRDTRSLTVRPPRLGGNKRMGVFATRSPNRPNSIGMSCLKLVEIDTKCKNAPVLRVDGADILDGTAIYDIKPYIPFTDCRPNATSGFTESYTDYRLSVVFSDEVKGILSQEQEKALCEILSLDPRPSYQNDPSRIYGLSLFEHNIKFKVNENCLTVIDIDRD